MNDSEVKETDREGNLSTQIRYIADTVKSIHECLYGDGNPGNGLTDRVTSIEIKTKWIVRVLWILCGVVASAVGIDRILNLGIFQ